MQSTTPKTNREFDQNKYNRKQVKKIKDVHKLKGERGNIAVLTENLSSKILKNTGMLIPPFQ